MEAENSQRDDTSQPPHSATEVEQSTESLHVQSSIVDSFHSLWDSYRYHVQRNQISLQLADDVLTRVIFWAPSSTSLRGDLSFTNHQWRQVAYGLLSLHRMAMDLALSHDQVVDSYGTTLQPSLLPTIPATAIRIALTVTHNLLPTFLELARGPQQQATCRLWLERVKFVIRLLLLTSYWRQVRNNETDDIVAGLLQNGGMYHVGFEQQVPSVQNVQALKFRRQYVGRRTGRRVTSGQATTAENGEQQNRILRIRLVIGELLRLYRPLYWAQAERNETTSPNTERLWKTWILTLVMEVASLQCLSGAVSQDNPMNQSELSRRRMKLFLYLLRSPMWDRTTEPSVIRMASAVRRVPLAGRLFESYMWEWLLYWKHAFVSEAE